MCGPIALTIPNAGKGAASPALSRLANVLLYNAGRVSTYAVYGLAFGLVGRSFAWFGWQQKISIALGLLILLALVLPRVLNRHQGFNAFSNNLFLQLREAMRKMLFKGHPASLYGLGVLNGLLPCGMVYLALAGAVAAGNAIDGALFMTMFGLGTIPSMAALSYFGGMMTPALRRGARKLFPAMMVLMAALLILRGLDLGIPYLSPSLNMSSSAAVSCHD